MSEIKKPTNKELLTSKKSFMLIKFGWSQSYIVPYDDGIKLQESLKNIELYDTESYDFHKIIPLPVDKSPEFTILTEQEYLNFKLRHILKLTKEDKNE